MSKNTQYIVRYDEAGNIVLSFWESPVVARLGACPEPGRREPREKCVEEAFVTRTVHIPEELHHIPSEVRHSKFPRAVCLIQKFRGGTSRMRIAKDSVHFVGTFTAVFLVLFLALNFASYKQVFHAALLPDANNTEERALNLITNPLLKNQLLSVPSLPRAGNGINILAFLPNVAPPDNRIILPSIGKNLPIVEAPDDALLRGDFGMFDDDVQNALKFGAVHYPGTAEPGQIGNVFVTAHSSNYPWIKSNYNAAFALLPKLKVGDEYSIFYKGNLHKYRVTEIFEVFPRDVSVLAQPKDKYMSTLMTCVPVGTTIKRLIVRAEEVDSVSGESLNVVQRQEAQIEG